VHRTGDLLVVPASCHEAARTAVEHAQRAFHAMAEVPDDAITAFFEAFAARLASEQAWTHIAEANRADITKARERARSTTRLEATDKMRADMVDGLRGWAKAPSRRGEVVERRDGEDWTVERRRAPLGVVAFVFEGRPNVFADGAGVLRGGNTSVMRIGSDALGTAVAISEHAIGPALVEAGLPDGALVLVRSPAHAAAHALFTMPEVRLAVARGSGEAVGLLGSIAEQHGIPASMHGTGGAWLYLAPDADGGAARAAVRHSVDRKVCNTLNVLVVARERAADLVPVALEALQDRDPDVRLHVTPGARPFLPAELFERRVAVQRADGPSEEPQVSELEVEDLGREWEWETTPEVSVTVAEDDEDAVALINACSPHFVASIVTTDDKRFERFYARVDAPYVGRGFTRWVDGQWAWGRPELGLANWERGRVMGRSGILAGDDVYTLRDVFVDTTGEAPQRR
jgi:glutamate-5-semialdehyde dehydrogenase